MRRVLAALLTLCGASACSSGEICDNQVDDDGDGFVDCADQDCAASCGEDCFNSLDDDGDGAVDCLDEDCEAACPGQLGSEDCFNGVDDDGDFIVDCYDLDDCQSVCDNDGDGAFRTDLGGNDCDDSDSDVNPSATEVPYNGKDDDCDPSTSDTDVDGDGVDALEVGGLDCNDANEHTFPGAPETCGDGEVNDCDEPNREPTREECFTRRSARTADATLLGNDLDDWAGFSVTPAGDVNGDGFADVAVGAYGEVDKHGAVYLIHGPVTGSLALAEAPVKWVSQSQDDWAGYAIAGGHDLTGDGRPDLAIGAQHQDQRDNNAGAVWIVDPDATGTVELRAPYFHAKLLGADRFHWTGGAVASPGDVTGDGDADLLVGAARYSPPTEAGAVFIVPGPIDQGETFLEHSERIITGKNDRDNTGCAVSGAGDVSGDGVQDILIGACLRDAFGRTDRGAAFLFSSANDTDLPRTVDDADGSFLGERAGDQMGAAVAAAGDLDGDGTDDIVIGAPFHDHDGPDGPVVDVGKAYVAFGPADVRETEPEVQIYGISAGDETGRSVAGVDDLNDDGHDDLVIGAPGRDIDGQTDAGAVFVLFGPVDSSVDLNDADFVLEGSAAFDFMGLDVAPAGDVDKDGFPDLLIGAPFHDGIAPAGGAAYVFTFGY